MQVSLFEEMLEEKESGEEVVIASLKLGGDFLDTHLIQVDGIPYIKQQLKKSRWWPLGHHYEDDNKPKINELCEGCLKTGHISELNEYKDCFHHGKAKRFRQQEG